MSSDAVVPRPGTEVRETHDRLSQASPAANRRPPERATAGEGRGFTVTAVAGLPRPVTVPPAVVSKATSSIDHHGLDVSTTQSASAPNYCCLAPMRRPCPSPIAHRP